MGQLGTHNCLPCELALFCAQFSRAWLDGEEAKPFPPGDFLPLNQTEQRREPSDSAEPDVTSAQVQPKRRRGRLVHISVTADARLKPEKNTSTRSARSGPAGFLPPPTTSTHTSAGLEHSFLSWQPFRPPYVVYSPCDTKHIEEMCLRWQFKDAYLCYALFMFIWCLF